MYKVLFWQSGYQQQCELYTCEHKTDMMQGIVNPLMVQKTDKRGGTIVSSPAAQAQAAEAAPPAKKPKVSRASWPHNNTNAAYNTSAAM